LKETILIYSPQTSNRLAYTATILFGQENYKITESETEFENYDGSKINYSIQQLENAVQILPDGLLNEAGIQNIHASFIISDDRYQLFFQKQRNFFNDNIIGFDVFSAVFYIISRYEEYNIYTPDLHGRFCGKSSIAYKYNIHTKPLVDIWRQMIWEKLKGLFSTVQIPEIKYHTIATIDIDRLYLYKEKGFIKSAGGMVKDILSGKFKNIAKRLKVLLGKEKDPHDNLSTTIDYYKNKQIHLNIFWLLGDKLNYDTNLPFEHPEQKETIIQCSKYAEIGIHPSYDSFNNIDKIKTEKQRLETILGKPVTSSRQHFLRMQLPQTYQQLVRAGITHDYTMGWHDIVGFRAGTAHTFNWYDIANEAETILQITPFAAMDVTLKNYMKLTPEQASIIITDLQDEVKKYGGTFVTIAHNESLSGWGEWDGWELSVCPDNYRDYRRRQG